MRKTYLVVIVAIVALGAFLISCGEQSAPAPTATKPATAAPSTGAAADGKAIFDRNCNGCHPGGGQGVGPALKDTALSVDQIKDLIRKGKGQMPAFPASAISDADLQKVAEYTKALQ